MSVDGPPGFQLLRLGFLRIAIQSSEALGPRGYFFRRGLAADRVGQDISPRSILDLISINSRRIGADHFWRTNTLLPRSRYQLTQ